MTRLLAVGQGLDWPASKPLARHFAQVGNWLPVQPQVQLLGQFGQALQGYRVKAQVVMTDGEGRPDWNSESHFGLDLKTEELGLSRDSFLPFSLSEKSDAYDRTALLIPRVSLCSCQTATCLLMHTKFQW